MTFNENKKIIKITSFAKKIQMLRSLTYSFLYICIFISVISCNKNDKDITKFAGPTQAIIGDDGLLYISDGYYNSRIIVFTKDGKFIRTWGTKGYANGQFHNPHCLTFLNNQTLLVADRDNGRIQLFDLEGKYLGKWYGKDIGRPWGICVFNNETVFVADGGDQNIENLKAGIVQLNKNGEFIKRFGIFGSEYGEFNEPHSIAVAPDSDLIVVDLKNERIQKLHLNVNNEYIAIPDWPKLKPSIDYSPLGVCIFNNKVYVSQQIKGAPILVIDLISGTLSGSFGSGLFERAHSVFVENNNCIWISDVNDNHVYCINFNGQVLLKI